MEVVQVVPVWLLVSVALVSILSTIGSIIAVIISRLSKGNFAEFELNVIKTINGKLEAFIKRPEFQVYVESHAKEHKVLDEEITKLRSFKHDIGAEIRKTGAGIEDLKDDVKEIKQDIRDERKDGI